MNSTTFGPPLNQQLFDERDSKLRCISVGANERHTSQQHGLNGALIPPVLHGPSRASCLVATAPIARPLVCTFAGGMTTLSVKGEPVATIGRGGFVNDVAFQQGEDLGAYGTCVATGPITVIAWEQKKLRETLLNDQRLASAMSHVLVGS